MSDHLTGGGHDSFDGIGRWLLGGLAAGFILLGLLIAAYAVGYHRAERAAAPADAPTSPTATTAAPTTRTTVAIGPVAITPALVARGKSLYTADGCSACHSLTGAAGAGPSFKGVAGAGSTLTTGETVTADDAYLARAITDPDAQIVKGYHPGIMGPAIAGHDLAAHPADVRALIGFIKSQKEG
jgi:mono/diheme cytochrome c family protein